MAAARCLRPSRSTYCQVVCSLNVECDASVRETPVLVSLRAKGQAELGYMNCNVAAGKNSGGQAAAASALCRAEPQKSYIIQVRGVRSPERRLHRRDAGPWSSGPHGQQQQQQ